MWNSDKTQDSFASQYFLLFLLLEEQIDAIDAQRGQFLKRTFDFQEETSKGAVHLAGIQNQ